MAKEPKKVRDLRVNFEMVDLEDDEPETDDAPQGTPIGIAHADMACAEDDLDVYAALPQELAMFTNPSSVLDALWIYFNYCYYLCLLPFKIVRSKPWRYSIQKSTPQQVVCGILHLLFLFYWVKKFRTGAGILSVISEGPPQFSRTKEYFMVLLTIAELCYVLALLYSAWAKSRVFQHIANAYHQLAKFEEEEDPDINPVDESQPIMRLVLSYLIRIALSILGKRYVVGIFLCCLFTSFAAHDFFQEYDDELRKGNAIFGEDGYFVNATKELFYLEQFYIPLPIGYFIGVFYVIISLLYLMLINLGNLFYTLIALMLANLGNNFENLLALPDVTGPQIIGEYQRTRDFVKYINDKMGVLTLFLVLSAVPYYATLLPSVVDNEVDALDRIFYGANLANYALVLYLTSTLQEKMKKMHEWFVQKENAGVETGVSSEQQRVVMEELTRDSVALSAFGFFAVSYATIGRILQILVTYGFVSGEGGVPGHLKNITDSFVQKL